MASTFISTTSLLSHRPTLTPSAVNRRLPVGSLRVNAISKKFEPTKVVPQADRVLIRLEQLPEKSAGGVLLPKSAVKFERYLMGEILSVGAEVEQVEAGKKVLFSTLMLTRWTWEQIQNIAFVKLVICLLWLSEVSSFCRG